MTHRTNTERRDRILLYMRMYCMTYGKQPTVREIGKAVGISSTSTIAGYLQRMEREGVIGRNECRNRTYFATEPVAEKLTGTVNERTTA